MHPDKTRRIVFMFLASGQQRRSISLKWKRKLNEQIYETKKVEQKTKISFYFFSNWERRLKTRESCVLTLSADENLIPGDDTLVNVCSTFHQ